ncbi:MAG: hypothetical protein IKB07_04710 [Lachnospiraceae bacterium]|nr:hypothetical protein [Lachnospiraceae bacterium]
MTDSTEHGIEAIVSGILFCMAFLMLLGLHEAFLRQLQVAGKEPERLILFEETGETEWNLLDV